MTAATTAASPSSREDMFAVKLVADLDEAEVAACAKLTNPDGYMRQDLLRLRNYRDHPRVPAGWDNTSAAVYRRAATYRHNRALSLPHDSVVLRYSPRGRLAGWALIYHSSIDGDVVYLYVAPWQRRRGHGRALMDEVLRRWPKARFCPWNHSSYTFFRTYAGNGHAIRYTMNGNNWVRKHPAAA